MTNNSQTEARKLIDGLSLSECVIFMKIAEHRASIASLEAERDGVDPDEASDPYCRECWMYEEQAHKLIPVSADDFLAAINLLHKSLIIDGEEEIDIHKQLMNNIRKGIHIAYGTKHGRFLANSLNLKSGILSDMEEKRWTNQASTN